MIPLTIGIAILGVHTRFTHLQTDVASLLLAALGTAGCHLVSNDVLPPKFSTQDYYLNTLWLPSISLLIT